MTGRYDRQGFLGKDSERILNEATIAYAGLGGGGSHMVQQSAYLGIGGYKLFDPDRISISNLNRTVGATPEDVRQDRLKVDIAERQILGILPDARIEKHAKEWELCGPAIRSADIIVGCVDGYRARDNLERIARRYHIPYVDIGMVIRENLDGFAIGGQVIASVPGGPCMRCLGFLDDQKLGQEAENYGDAGPQPQVIWSNGALASTAIGMIVQLLLPWNTRMKPVPYMEYNGNLHIMRPHPRLEYLPDGDCQHHQGMEAFGDVI